MTFLYSRSSSTLTFENVFEYIHVYVHICTHVHVCMCVHKYMCAYMEKNIYIRIYIYVYTYAYIHIYICKCKHIFVIEMYMYMYTYVFIGLLIYMHLGAHATPATTSHFPKRWKFGAIIIVFSIFNIEQNIRKFYLCMPAMPAATLHKVRFLKISGQFSYTVNSVASSPFRNGTLARLRFLPRRCTSVKISKVGSVRSFCTADLVASWLLGYFTLTRLWCWHWRRALRHRLSRCRQ